MSGRTLGIDTAEVFAPLLQPSRYKGAYGGRGSGKSHFFAGLMVEQAMLKPGYRGVCIREVQKSLKESAKRLIEDKIREHGLGNEFDIQTAEIKTPGGGVIIFQGMQDHTAESIKSLEGFDVAWAEEAQSLSQRSLTLLRPTIRSDGSELWFSWNPTRKTDPVDVLLRGASPPTDAVVVRANWSDNPWFPAVLEQERSDDERDRPQEYAHIWDGGYAKVTEGAYYAHELLAARQQRRVGHVAADPLLPVMTFWDLGGRGQRSDATAIWVAQFIGREIRVLDYYEAQGQPLSVHVAWLRDNGYTDVLCVLPHDGAPVNPIADRSWQSALEEAGFETEVVPNQGAGAYMQRVQAGRRLFPAIWFNEPKTEFGLERLGDYHEKRDDNGMGLGPNRNKSTHCGDAFGLMCVYYEEAKPKTETIGRPRYHGANAWMG